MPSPPNGSMPAPESKTAPSVPSCSSRSRGGRAFQQQQFTMDGVALALHIQGEFHLLLPYGTVQVRIEDASSVGRKLSSTSRPGRSAAPSQTME